MRVGNYWRPTRAAAERLDELGLEPKRGKAPNAHLHLEAELPEEFVILVRGSATHATLVGVEGEPAAQVMRRAERIARERKELRPGEDNPDGQLAHDEQVAVEALKEMSCTRPSYNGDTLPWDHHEWFAVARGTAFRAAQE